MGKQACAATDAPEADLPARSRSSNVPLRESLILSGAIVLIGLLFLVPSLFDKPLINYFSVQLGADLCSAIPAALARYRIWVALTTTLFAMLHNQLLPLIGMKEEDIEGKRLEQAGAEEGGQSVVLSFDKRLIYTCVLAVLLNLLLLTRTWQFPYCIDDAYIVFRIVDNALSLGAPDFDPGIHVNAIASLSHFLALIVTCFLTGWREIPVVSQTINLAWEVASLFVLFALLKRLFGKVQLALFGCAIHVMSAYAILEVMRGKEGCSMMLLLFIYLLAQTANLARTKAWATCLICLTRAEGFILFATTLANELRQKSIIAGPSLIRAWAVPLAVVGLSLMTIALYCGTIVPQGAIVKSTVFHAPIFLCSSFIFAQVLNSFVGIPCFVEGALGLTALILAYLLMGTLLWPYASLRPYLISLILVSAFFIAGNALIAYFPWYLSWWAPLPPLVFTAILHRINHSHLNSRIAGSGQAIIALYSLVFVPFHAYMQPAPYSGVYSRLPIFYWDNLDDRLRMYEEAREYLKKVSSPNDTIAVSEVGIISYTFRRCKIFDLLGMVTPEALTLYPVPLPARYGAYSIPPQYIRLYKPERLLTMECMIRNGVAKDEYFKRNYEIECFWQNDAFQSNGIYLFKKRQAAR